MCISMLENCTTISIIVLHCPFLSSALIFQPCCICLYTSVYGFTGKWKRGCTRVDYLWMFMYIFDLYFFFSFFFGPVRRNLNVGDVLSLIFNINNNLPLSQSINYKGICLYGWCHSWFSTVTSNEIVYILRKLLWNAWCRFKHPSNTTTILG